MRYDLSKYSWYKDLDAEAAGTVVIKTPANASTSVILGLIEFVVAGAAGKVRLFWDTNDETHRIQNLPRDIGEGKSGELNTKHVGAPGAVLKMEIPAGATVSGTIAGGEVVE